MKCAEMFTQQIGHIFTTETVRISGVTAEDAFETGGITTCSPNLMVNIGPKNLICLVAWFSNSHPSQIHRTP